MTRIRERKSPILVRAGTGVAEARIPIDELLVDDRGIPLVAGADRLPNSKRIEQQQKQDQDLKNTLGFHRHTLPR
jgi:hypothetical protein